MSIYVYIFHFLISVILNERNQQIRNKNEVIELFLLKINGFYHIPSIVVYKFQTNYHIISINLIRISGYQNVHRHIFPISSTIVHLHALIKRVTLL